jgi:hypothetical protein
MRAAPVGTKRMNRGYVQVKITTGCKKYNWELEHRVVWEATHGSIPPGGFIHHLNGNKADNRLENLHLTHSNAEHHREYHAAEHRERGRRVGLSGRGKPKSPEHRAKIAAAHRGRPKSPEHRAKLAAALRGRARPDISARLRGQPRKLTPAQHARLAELARSRQDARSGRFV